jgi:pyruvate dehydrogenase E2 component (dihydrolipoamide acetyltransferase)
MIVDGERREPTRIQRTIAQRMAASHAEVPDFALEADIDMEAAVHWRGERRAAGERVPSLNDMIVRACAKSLRRHPKANGSWCEEAFLLHERVNIGVAVAGDGALVVPVVHDADRMGTLEIGARIRDLADAVRERRVSLDQLTGATFTVSNLGMFGIDRFAAMVNPPQAAILAAGALARRPVCIEDEVTARHQLTLTLSCDHRVLYGAEGAEFLASVRAELLAPDSLDRGPAVSDDLPARRPGSP